MIYLKHSRITNCADEGGREGEREKEIMIRKQGRLEMGGTRPHKFKS